MTTRTAHPKVHQLFVDRWSPRAFDESEIPQEDLDAIFAEGLKPGRRQQVHLSLDPETARKVGERHGKATVLAVSAERMHGDGYQFFRADNGVWLTDHVPAGYLGF